MADAVARRSRSFHARRSTWGSPSQALSALELMRTLALYPPQPNTPSLPPFAPHRPNLRLTCVYAYIRLRLRLRLRLLGLPHGCLHTRPHPCPRLRLHPRVPIVCLWLYAYAYAVVAAPLPPPPPPPPPPPRPRRPPAAAEPPHHRFHRRHRRLRGRLPRHCYTTHPTHRELAWDFRATSHTLISSKWEAGIATAPSQSRSQHGNKQAASIVRPCS